MFYVYYILSEKTKEHYIGCTSDLKRRLFQHNNNESNSTKNKLPWRLIYYEAYKSKLDAFRREKMLKYDGRAKAMLKKRIAESISEEGAA